MLPHVSSAGRLHAADPARTAYLPFKISLVMRCMKIRA
jgi:hypothetical protein